MATKEFHAFTTKFNGLANQLQTPIAISEPTKSRSEAEECSAIWDTGASTSAITTKLVKKLGLKPVGKTNVKGVNGVQLRNVYLVSVYLPSRVVVGYTKMTECDDLVGNAEVLIGMNVINLGDMAVTNVDGKTTLSFRIPSIETIDYVEEADKIKARQNQRKLKESKGKIREKRKKERKNKKKGRKK